MIPDLDIYRSASVLMKRHGAHAPIEAAMRAGIAVVREESRAKIAETHASSANR